MSATEYANRRQQLMAQLPPKSVVIVPTRPAVLRSRDTEYPYRSDSDFYYLTGFAEPQAVLLLCPGRTEGEFILFSRASDPEAEIWTGRRAGQAGAIECYGAEEAYPYEDIDQHIPGFLEDCDRVYYPVGVDRGFDQRVVGWLNRVRSKGRNGVNSPDQLVDIRGILHEMRLVKQPAELSLMRYAADVSCTAHRHAMRACQPGMMEYELEAEFWHVFIKSGCRYPAYMPIVAGGSNACILHYTDNDQPLQNDELVLIDAGAEYKGYAADITRTFPVNGRFTAEQQALYEVVLAAQDVAISVVGPGHHFNQAHYAAVAVLTQGLVDLGILQGDVNELIQQEAYKPFYMHRTSHWLGMDVHDVGAYKRDEHWRTLQPGMVMTVEPGLYIRPSAEVDARWHGIGIRIEDDVLVTEDGCEILTEQVPKQIDDIYALMDSE